MELATALAWPVCVGVCGLTRFSLVDMAATRGAVRTAPVQRSSPAARREAPLTSEADDMAEGAAV